MAEAQFNNGNHQNDYPIVIRFGYTNKRRWRQQTVKNGDYLSFRLTSLGQHARLYSYVESNFKKLFTLLFLIFFIVYIDKRNYTVGQNSLNVDDIIY